MDGWDREDGLRVAPGAVMLIAMPAVVSALVSFAGRGRVMYASFKWKKIFAQLCDGILLGLFARVSKEVGVLELCESFNAEESGVKPGGESI